MIIVNKLRKKYVKVLTISTYILLITYVTSVILYIQTLQYIISYHYPNIIYHLLYYIRVMI